MTGPSSSKQTAAPPKFRPRLFAGLVLLIGVLLSWFLSSAVSQNDLRRAQEQAQHLAKDHAIELQRHLEHLTSSLYLVDALVQEARGVPRDYNSLLERLLPQYPGITSLALAPGGIVAHVVPQTGNEASLGLDLLHDPRFAAGAQQARDSEKLVLTGPFSLVQGGWGIVGRLPIFLPANGQGKRMFWGLANAVIRLDLAFASHELAELQHLGYDYELWLPSPSGTDRTVLLSSFRADAAAPHDGVEHTLHVADATWTLSLYPRRLTPYPIIRNHLVGWLISALLAWITYMWMQQRQQKNRLQQEVQDRTSDILTTKQQLNATLQAIPDLLFETDRNGQIYLIHTQNPETLLAPPAQLIGRNHADFLPPEALKVVNEALDEAHATGRSLGKQYMLDIDGQSLWFELSVSRKPVLGQETPHFISLVRNITTRKRAQLQSALTTEFFQGSNEGFVITDAEQRIIQVNPAFTQITGYAQEEVIGLTPKVLSSGRQGPDFYKAMWEQISSIGEWQGEVWNRRKNGELYPEWLSISRIRDAAGHTTHFIAIFSDNTRRREQEARIRSLAYFDPLTGLANRTLLKDRVQHDLSQARRHRSSLSLLFIDLDHFKQINDSLGHRTGDDLLKQVGERLQQLVREQDTIARLGGDEFVAVLPETDADGASHVAQGILKRLAQPYLVNQQELAITPSIGIALFPEDGDDFDALYRCADTAMYRAKQEGRNGYSFFTPEMQAQSIRRLQLENALRRALERDQLSLHYQPQMSLSSEAIVGVEVLLRWQHPEWGMVSPAEFIPIAESSGLILSIGEWVLKQACLQAKRWQDAGLPPLVMAVNLSAVQFRHPQLPALVGQILQTVGLPARCLELELTESAAMHDPQAAIETMDTLHRQGVLMSVDDFGTGYSSLNYLKRFQVYKLKIDQSFVRDVLSDPEDASIVETIIQMAHSLGLVTIAEGVETREQLEFLRERGCQELQGYFLARPLPAGDFESWLRQRLSALG